MPRGTAGNVLLYSGTTDVETAVIWLDAANAVVTARLSASGLAGGVLARIEEHLAAHYIELGQGPVKTSERLPDWEASYAVGELANLQATRNGQIAVALDTSGTLAEQSKPRPTFAVLGPS